MTPASRKFLETIARLLKGVITAFEEWIKDS